MFVFIIVTVESKHTYICVCVCFPSSMLLYKLETSFAGSLLLVFLSFSPNSPCVISCTS